MDHHTDKTCIQSVSSRHSTMYTGVILLCLLHLVSANEDAIVYQTKYFDAPLDHFNFRTDSTFKLRYLINDSYWKPHDGAPIFFYPGNEDEIESFTMNTGFMWENAPEFNALIVFAEHRYYGKSLPFGKTPLSDPKYFGYLSTPQAMADYVTLIKYIKDSYKVPLDHNPVVAIGGSYGGMLATWMRMKYPSIIQGALASSAPIWQFTGMTPCDAFNKVTSSAYITVSDQCAKSIKKSWGHIDQLAFSEEGLKWLTSNFKLCSPLKEAKKLKDWLKGIYVNLAMTNYPYPTNFLTPLPANPVENACKYLVDFPVTAEESLKNIYSAVSIYFNGTGTLDCLKIDDEKDADITWDYQKCTEVIMPMCDNGLTDMFEASTWDIKQVSDNCFNRFKARPQPEVIELEYGGKHISWVTNIIFSNGLKDPWSSGGVFNNISSSTIAIVIPESAHHLDLRFSNKADPVSIKEARMFYKKTFTTWIQQHRHQSVIY